MKTASERLFNSACEGDYAKFVEILDSNPDIDIGHSLYIAGVNGHLDIVKEILVRKKAKHLLSATYWAKAHGQNEVVKELEKHINLQEND